MVRLSTNGKLSDYIPCAPTADRPAWYKLCAEWKTQSVPLGEQYLHYSYPPITATDYMDFTRTGNRTRYEDKFFARQRALCALVLAECVEAHSARIKNQIFTPYIKDHFWWMDDGEQPMNNWTIWCTQNVLLSVFLTDTYGKDGKSYGAEDVSWHMEKTV